MSEWLFCQIPQHIVILVHTHTNNYGTRSGTLSTESIYTPPSWLKEVCVPYHYCQRKGVSIIIIIVPRNCLQLPWSRNDIDNDKQCIVQCLTEPTALHSQIFVSFYRNDINTYVYMYIHGSVSTKPITHTNKKRVCLFLFLCVRIWIESSVFRRLLSLNSFLASVLYINMKFLSLLSIYNLFYIHDCELMDVAMWCCSRENMACVCVWVKWVYTRLRELTP